MKVKPDTVCIRKTKKPDSHLRGADKLLLFSMGSKCNDPAKGDIIETGKPTGVEL